MGVHKLSRHFDPKTDEVECVKIRLFSENTQEIWEMLWSGAIYQKNFRAVGLEKAWQ